MESSPRPRIRAVIGLGNPGDTYNRTRHNLGFEVVDRLAGNKPFAAGTGNYFLCEINLESNPIVLLKPTTFMNRSGLAVVKFARLHGLTPPQILVVSDDFYLQFGHLRLRQGGSDGGHKGLASIIYHLESDAFPRIRLGIGPVPARIPAEDFVLERFKDDERPTADEMIKSATQAATTWINEGFNKAAALFNRAIDDN